MKCVALGIGALFFGVAIAADPAKHHSSDGTHFNDDGAKLLGKIVADCVRPMLADGCK